MKTVLRITVACICLILTLAAYSGEEPREELRPVAISAFKNGLAFVVRQGDVTLTNGSGVISPIPAATLGALWIAPNDSGTSLDEVIAYRSKFPKAHDIASMAELLMANTGKTLTLVDVRQQEYTGEIVRVEADAKPEPMNNPDAVVYPRPTPELLILRSGGKLLALHLGAIDHVVLPADPVLQASVNEERAALRFKIKGASTHANLTMGYLEHGFGWTPSYLVSLEDDKTAQVTMQAVVVNDAESVRDADLFFVVGVPNFQYAGIPSPMSLQQTLLDFMQAASRRDQMKDGPYSNALRSQMAEAKAYDGGGIGGSLAQAVDDLQGAPEEDLFLYTRKGVTLAKGERGMFNVFTASVPYEHIYQWEVQDPPRVDAYGNVQNNNQRPEDIAPQNVWHSIRLKNSTKYPWTSAPATVISSMKPLAQDTLPYSPKGASSNLRLTIATDLRTSSKETEVEREKSIQLRRGYNYDAVTVEGRLKIKNYKSKEVRVGISKTMRGTVLIQSDLGTSEKVGEAIVVDNPLSHMTWEIQLKPGEERTITYRYKVMVHV